MPLMKCRKKSRSGWKFGRKGKCYIGRGALEKAKIQGRAIKWRQSLKK